MNEAEREGFRNLYNASHVLRERLTEIVEQEMTSAEGKLSDYEIASWPYRQAHLNGRNEALRRVLLLIQDKE